MIERNVQGVEFICANTDAQALSRSSAHKHIQLGNSGLGAGSKPEKGRECAEAAVEDIRQAIAGAHMLFITAGMGGGTGTGAAPVIARVAKEMGIRTVASSSQPSTGKRPPMTNPTTACRLERNVDSLIVVLTSSCRRCSDDIRRTRRSDSNDVLKNAVGASRDHHVPGHVNVDFADVRT